MNEMPPIPAKRPFLRNRLLVKTDIPAILSVILFAGLIFVFLIPGFEKAMMDRKRFLLTDMTSSVYSLLEHYHGIEKDGIEDSLTIRNMALNAVGSIRYGNSGKDYFWITNLHPTMMIHPYRPDLNGQDMTEFTDPNGKRVFVEFVKAASATGEGFVDYMWQWNDDSTRIVPKLSYVRLFKPWGWVIGTGIYIDDVREEIRRIEVKALLISAIIVTIVIILLSIISRQTHRIENKRKIAEEELKRSKELYRTLAEAASEGVLIWSQKGIQANKTLLSWIGFNEDEILDKKITSIFISPLINESTNPENLYEELTARQYLEGSLVTRNGQVISAHADLSAITLDEMKAVMIAIRPAGNKAFTEKTAHYRDIYDNISTGFFRITFGRKNRFIHVSLPLVKMLGFDSPVELLTYAAESFFDDQDRFRSIRKMLGKKEQVINLPVTLLNKDGARLPVLLNAVVVETPGDETWCEGTVEQLSASHIDFEIPSADFSYHAASYIMRSPALSIMGKLILCPAKMPVGEVAEILSSSDSGYAAVVDTENNTLGTISLQDIALKLKDGIPASAEAFRFMNSPPATIPETSEVAEALRKLRSSQKGCLIVMSDSGAPAGLISYRSLAPAFFSSPPVYKRFIGSASTPEALRLEYLRGRDLAVSMITGKADPYSVSLFLTALHDSICSRAVELAIVGKGAPPCRFAFFVTGSAGRRELSLLTDQDNALIYEDPPAEKANSYKDYFLGLGKMINSILETAGYELCRGGNMAGNNRWCRPETEWKDYFSKWIKSPGPEEILEISIFFDFRFCYGDPALTNELRNYINNDLRTNDIFFHNMAEAWMNFAPGSGYKPEKTTDIKKLLLPLTGIIRLYSLKQGISDLSTPERTISLMELFPAGRTIFRETLRSWKNLSTIRLMSQAISILNSGEPVNTVNLKDAGEEYIFLTARAVEGIKELMLKASNDFYVKSI